MKTKKKDIYGRTYTKRGYFFHILLTTISVVSFILMLGFTGACEMYDVPLRTYVVRVIPCIVVFMASTHIHHKVFE